MNFNNSGNEQLNSMNNNNSQIPDLVNNMNNDMNNDDIENINTGNLMDNNFFLIFSYISSTIIISIIII